MEYDSYRDDAATRLCSHQIRVEWSHVSACCDTDPASATASAAEQLEKNRDFLQLENWMIGNLEGFSDAAITVADLLPETHQIMSRSVNDYW